MSRKFLGFSERKFSESHGNGKKYEKKTQNVKKIGLFKEKITGAAKVSEKTSQKSKKTAP